MTTGTKLQWVRFETNQFLSGDEDLMRSTGCVRMCMRVCVRVCVCGHAHARVCECELNKNTLLINSLIHAHTNKQNAKIIIHCETENIQKLSISECYITHSTLADIKRNNWLIEVIARDLT